MEIPEQSELLRKWMATEGITRREACERLGVKERRFNAWLLPPTSKERRTADSVIISKVGHLLEEALKVNRANESGAMGPGVDAADPYICERTGIVFPAIFRVPMDCAEIIDGKVVDIPSHYDTFEFSNPGNRGVEIKTLTAGKDQLFLHCVHLQSFEEAEGFWVGNMFDVGEAGELINVCSYNGAFFGLVVREHKEQLHGCIAYTTRYIDNKNPVLPGPNIEFETHGYGPDGQPLTGDDLHGRLWND